MVQPQPYEIVIETWKTELQCEQSHQISTMCFHFQMLFPLATLTPHPPKALCAYWKIQTITPALKHAHRKLEKDIAQWKPLQPVGVTASSSRLMFLCWLCNQQREKGYSTLEEVRAPKWCFCPELLSRGIHLSPLAIQGLQGNKPL